MATWADAPTREHLTVVAEGAATLAGFEMSAISVRRGDRLEVVAAAGAGVAERMIGTTVPVSLLEVELDRSDQWGSWRFVPHERVGAEVLDYSHISHGPTVGGPDAWHPLDLLAAPLLDDAGELRGLLSVDAPRDGMRPGPLQRALLEDYAGLARTLVLLAMEREELAERVRMATEARRVVRRALAEPSLDLVVEACRSAVVECFDAVGMWLTAFDTNGGLSTTWHAAGDVDAPAFSEVDDVVLKLAHRYWADQYVAHFSRGRAHQPGLDPEGAERILAFLDDLGLGTVLFVPLGVGAECVGFLALARVGVDSPWTEMEYDAALDIGRDLGRAVVNARQLEHERELVSQLRRLDGYRTELVRTLAHELRNPLTSVVANLELVASEELSETGRGSVAAAVRGAHRMEGVIDDLLTLARLTDPDVPFEPGPVDLREVVREVEHECRGLAQARSISCVTRVPDWEVQVPGRPEEMHRLVANLASNAIKYSDEGGTVRLGLTLEDGEVVLRVSDEGLGISESDQHELFQAFFRSTNPEALSRPGSGLGLVIVDRIVRRHGGQVILESGLGDGTTVTVRLPAMMDP